MKAEYVDHMGSDLSVVNAARVSFDKTSELVDGELSMADAKLIKYLAKHDHWTPFAHTSISLRMAAPVPIRTQCFKHKVGFVENEESRRYISTLPSLHVPKVLRAKPEGSIKQGSGAAHAMSDYWRAEYQASARAAVDLYQRMVTAGVCPEQARLVLPQGAIVNWVWTGNLVSFANFYKKRTDPNAQQEVQQLAQMVGEVIAPLFPVSWEALTA